MKLCVLAAGLMLSSGLFGSGFDEVKTRVELQKLIHGPEGRYCTVWKGTFYCGTKDGFHYIRHELGFAPDKCFRIRDTDLKVAVMKYPLKKSDCVEIHRLVEAPE